MAYSVSRISVAALAAVTSLAASTASAQITIPTVPIGNAGNAVDPFFWNLYGSVAYPYNIGRTEVTNAQYATFLNNVAFDDTHGLYNSNMGGSITRSGNIGAFFYSTIPGRANHPVTFVTFWNAARFANWLHNGQPTGFQDNTTTEDGTYTLGGVTSPLNTSVTRNADWQWAVTSEDEWYKAAYHQPASAGGDSDNYWVYPTSSNVIPTTAQANINNVIGNTTPVGSYAANFYGTFDMGGNVLEWTDTIIAGANRANRGGSFRGNFLTLHAVESPISNRPIHSWIDVGFRVSKRMPCLADLTGDWVVDDADFVFFAAAYEAFTVPPADAAADFNADGFVDDADFVIFAQAYEAFVCP